MQIIAAAAGAGVLLLAAFGFLLLRKKRRHDVELSAPHELPAAATPAAAASPGRVAAQAATEPLPELPPVRATRSDVVTERLREMVSQDAAGSAQVLRSWLADEER